LAKEINYLDVNKEDYFTYYFSAKEKTNEELKHCKIINIETLESVIRFWYYKED
jgi:hypothetical protein